MLRDKVLTVCPWSSSCLTSSKPTPADAANDKRIEFQRRVEDKYRQQLTQLLTPLVGAGNFTAEVQADVNLDETSATRESYDKAGALVDGDAETVAEVNDLWTFARDIRSRDPNWKLIATESEG